MKPYVTLNLELRKTIERLLKEGKSVKEIAEEIGCSKTTIYNEIKIRRVSNDEGDENCKPIIESYNAKYAEEVHRERLSLRGANLKIGKDLRLAEFIEKKIKEDNFSPRAVIMYMEKNSEELNFNVHIFSANTIYSYIEKNIFRYLSLIDLPTRERKKKKPRKIIVAREPVKGHSIEDRDRSEYAEEIKSRKVIGHWEADTVCSGRGDKSAILVLTERASRLHLMFPIPNKTSEEVVTIFNRIERNLGADFYKLFKTITFDNGSEFSDWKSIEKAKRRKGLRFKMYYAHPRNPQERGSNENNNKLIRRKIPKGMKIGRLTAKFIRSVQDFISNYPRLLFNGLSSKEVFIKLCKEQNIPYEKLAI